MMLSRRYHPILRNVLSNIACGSSSLCVLNNYSVNKPAHYFHHFVPSVVDDEFLPSRLPIYIRQKLESLQHEILKTLMHDNESDNSSLISSCLSNEAFTQKFQDMVKYYFNQGGKLFRPLVCLLIARACNQLDPECLSVDWGRDTVTSNQYKISLISEMIHTASLVHDDVIDEANIRRGSPTVNALWGNKMAVLVGDFILARATQVLCSIGRPSVIAVMAKIIEDLVKGEFMQMTGGESLDTAERYKKYMAKTYSKTASLFANSCKSAAMLSDVSKVNESIAYEYGKSLGIAFQMIDDLLDFVTSSNSAGKPTAIDLTMGLATAPVLFAAEEYPELNKLMNRSFSKEGDVELAWTIVVNSSGLEKTRAAARKHTQQAVEMAKHFPNGDGVRDHLVHIALTQLDRDR